MSLLTKLEMDQAKEPQEGNRGMGLGDDGCGAAEFRVPLRKCLNYSISIKNVWEEFPSWCRC